MKKIYFKDFITLQRGFDLPNKRRKHGLYPVIASTSIAGFHNKFKVMPPGVVTGRSGALGEVQYTNKQFWPLNTTLFVKDFKGNYPRYVYYFLKTIDLKRFNSGAGVPTLNRNDLDTLEIKIHDYETQRKIASILSAYDDLIEKNNQRIQILEEMAQAIYKEWFINFRFPVHEKVKMVESESGLIPEGWGVRRLGEIAEIITGKTPPTKVQEYLGNKYPFITPTDIKSFDVLYLGETERYLSEGGYNFQKDLAIPPDSICFVAIGSTVGKMCMTDRVSFTNQQIHSIIANKDIVSTYYLFYKIRLETAPKIKAIADGKGSGKSIINKTEFSKLEILIPDKELCPLFDSLVKPIFNHIKNLQSQIVNLRRTRDLLLFKLISREIDVEGLDINIKGENI